MIPIWVIFQVKFNPYLSCKINVGSILEWFYECLVFNYDIKWCFLLVIYLISYSVELVWSSHRLQKSTDNEYTWSVSWSFFFPKVIWIQKYSANYGFNFLHCKGITALRLHCNLSSAFLWSHNILVQPSTGEEL